MTLICYSMMGEQADPRQLVRDVALAEQAGFGFAAISDHYFPWLEAQGLSPYAPSTLHALRACLKKDGTGYCSDEGIRERAQRATRPRNQHSQVGCPRSARSGAITLRAIGALPSSHPY